MRFSRSFPRALFLSLVLPPLVALFLSGTGMAQTPAATYEQTLIKMFDAIQSKSHDTFVADGEAWFKSNFTAKMFDDLAQQLGPRLKQGYSLTFLTTLNRMEHVGYVWKLALKGGKEDYLASLFIKDGHVSGFMVR
ncbi:MAG: hypothetical protein ACYC7L_06970 [Nitrospirota bacterium]